MIDSSKNLTIRRSERLKRKAAQGGEQDETDRGVRVADDGGGGDRDEGEAGEGLHSGDDVEQGHDEVEDVGGLGGDVVGRCGWPR